MKKINEIQNLSLMELYDTIFAMGGAMNAMHKNFNSIKDTNPSFFNKSQMEDISNPDQMQKKNLKNSGILDPYNNIVPKFKSIVVDNHQVVIGTNAEQNEILSLKYTEPNDIWMHASKIPGAHVVIKTGGKTSINKLTLIKVAQLAAYNSKGKNMDIVPVVYCLGKNLYKRPGTPAGTIEVWKRNIVNVKPQNI